MNKPRETQEQVFARVEQENAFWVAKAARMKLLGEDQVPAYQREYEACLERINATRRCLARRARHPSSNIKASP